MAISVSSSHRSSSIAVQPLVILPISIENCGYATESASIGRLEVEFGLAKKRTAVDA